jgi:glutamate-1-semialdehyde 2,1-aminomutase
MRSIEDGAVYQVGTYNGNPLSMAAARASFLEVMTPDAYAHLEHLNDRLHQGLGEIIERHGFPAHVIGLGAKGCIVFSPEPVLNYRDWAHKTNGPLNELAWLYNMNRGVFMTPGREEEWTLSVQHDDADIDRFIDVFAELAADLTA